MRKLLLVLLLAGAASPAISAPREDRDSSDRDRPKAERSEPRPQRAEREERRSEPAERPQVRVERDRPAPPADRPQLNVKRNDSPPVSRRRPDAPVPERAVADRPDTVRDWRAIERRRDDSPSTIEERNLRRAPAVQDGDLVEQKRRRPPIMDRDDRRVSRTPVPGTEPPPPPTATARHADPERRWGTNWRRDKRYDWRDHRRRHRHKFHLSFYFDPFGWNYRRYGIGWRLWPSYYSSRYWLHDPWMYRLPHAYGPFRWVRYWDDALLVNIYTGQVVDVIHDFFW